jgi:hypothetical protein
MRLLHGPHLVKWPLTRKLLYVRSHDAKNISGT